MTETAPERRTPAPADDASSSPAGAEIRYESRRARRQAETAALAQVAQRPAPVAPAAKAPASMTRSSRRATAPRQWARTAAVTVVMVPALFATVALPAYALNFQDTSTAQAAAALAEEKVASAQSVTVASGVEAATVDRDDYTSSEDAVALRQELATQYNSYEGPTAEDYLADSADSTAEASAAVAPSGSLSSVLEVGKQYIGVPYVYGGATPSGFDCSGLVKFVYAQFGVNLAHSVPAQAAAGTRIPASEAQPGDLVVWSHGGHDGIYAGNGNVLHAPNPSKSVEIRPIYGFESVYFVRLPI